MQKKKIVYLSTIIKKERKNLVLIEAIFLLLMIAVGCVIYSLFEHSEKEAIRNGIYELNLQLRYMDPTERTYANILETLYENLPIDDPISDNYGLTLQFYDNKDDITQDFSDSHIDLLFSMVDEDAEKDAFVNLYEYFDDDQLDALLRFYQKNKTTSNIDITKIMGFYESGCTLVPTEILFESYNVDSDEITTFHLGNPKSGQITLYDIENQTNTESEILEPIICTMNTNKKILNKLNQIQLQRGNFIYEEGNGMHIGGSIIVENRENPLFHYTEYSMYMLEDTDDYYAMKLSVNLGSIVWNNEEFVSYFWGTLILIQFFAILYMISFVYFQNRQQELTTSRNLFINAMAHELKTPAAAIQNTAEYLQMGARPEKQTHYLQMLQQESTHINHLLNQMLTYTRINDRAYHLNLQKTNLKELATDVIKYHQSSIQSKQITVEWMEQDNKNVRCDPELLRMVLDNMISNAIKYGNANGCIRITLQKKGIAIYNDGPQLPEEALAQIWDPMYRTDKARVNDGSTGMGLAISAGILNMHKATYGVQNKENGIEFHISF